MADSKSRVERLTRIFNEGIRLGIAISKPGHEGKWIDITESAIKLVADLQ